MALLTHANGSSNFSKRTGSGCRDGTIFKSEGDGEYMHCPVLCSEQANNVENDLSDLAERLNGRRSPWMGKIIFPTITNTINNDHSYAC